MSTIVLLEVPSFLATEILIVPISRCPDKLAEIDNTVFWVIAMPSKGDETTRPGVLLNVGGVGTGEDVAETVLEALEEVTEAVVVV